MRRPRFGLGVALLIAIPTSAAANPAHTASRAAPSISPAAQPAVAIVDAFHAALQRGDTQAAAALLADDVLIFEAGGAERSKAEYLAEHLPADSDFARTTEARVARRVGQASGATVWIASEGRTTGEFRGRPINSRTTETMILTRVGGMWRITHIHWSSSAIR